MKLGMNTTMFWNANYLRVFKKSILNTYFRKRPSALKFGQLMKTKNKMKLNKICRFIKVINKAVCTPILILLRLLLHPVLIYYII